MQRVLPDRHRAQTDFARRFFEAHRSVAYISHMNRFERRGAPRVPVAVAIQQYVEGQTHRCHASDLSLSGLYMERPITTFVRHSAHVELEIPLPDGSEPLRAQAEIVYDCFDAEVHGTAVRFKALNAHDRARLSAFLTSEPPSVA